MADCLGTIMNHIFSCFRTFLFITYSYEIFFCFLFLVCCRLVRQCFQYVRIATDAARLEHIVFKECDRFPVFIYLKIFIFIFWVWMFCLCVCLCMMCAPGTDRDQKRMLDLLELKLQMVVCCCVDSKNRTWVLWKSFQFSSPVGHLSSPKAYFIHACVSVWVYGKHVWILEVARRGCQGDMELWATSHGSSGRATSNLNH